MKQNYNYSDYSKYKYVYVNYNKKNHKKTFFTLIFLFFTIFVLVAFSVAFSSNFFVNKVASFNYQYAKQEKTLYALSLCSFSEIDSAKKQVESVKNQGGAGYIFCDSNEYNVIGSIYHNLSDAESVRTSLEKSGIISKIVTLTLPKVVLKANLSSKSNEILTEGLNLFYENYEKMYYLSNKFDKQEIDIIKLKSELNLLKQDNQKVIDNFSLHFSQSSNVNILYVKIYLQNINKAIDNFLQLDDAKNYSSEIKSCYCNVVQSYLNLCTEMF